MRLILPTDTRFTCLACGRCCRTTTISLSAGEAERLASIPAPSGDSPTVEPYRISKGRGFRIRPRPDGSCPYLDEDDLCAIHKEHGLQAKPLACRLFPLTFLRTPDGLTVPLRFSCPAVALGAGAPLKEEDEQLRRLAKDMGDVTAIKSAGDPVRFDKDRKLPFADAKVLVNHLEALLDAPGLDLPARLASCLEFMDLVALSSLEAESRFRYWQGLRDGLPARFRSNPVIPPSPPTGLDRLLFRQTAFALGSIADPSLLRLGVVRNAAHRLKRLVAGPLYMLGRGTLGRAPRHLAVDTVIDKAGALLKGARPEDPLLRFLRVQIATHAFYVDFPSSRGFLDGFLALFLTIPFSVWFARASGSTQNPTLRDAVEGIVRMGDALSIPNVLEGRTRGLTGWVFRRKRTWEKSMAWALGTEAGSALRFPGPQRRRAP